MTRLQTQVWKVEEVPLGKIVIQRNSVGALVRRMLTAVQMEAQGVVVSIGANCMATAESLRDNYTMEDGAPCGVLEEG